MGEHETLEVYIMRPIETVGKKVDSITSKGETDYLARVPGSIREPTVP